LGRQVILDTNLLIDFERGRFNPERLDDDLAVAAITVAEFRIGIELADSEQRTEARSRRLMGLIGSVAVLPYTQATAIHHARLMAYARKTGRQRGRHDVVIAAHAAETGRVLLSRDAVARFGGLPGVTALER
jgi:predicted nucleic acid-binding protein